MTSWMISGRTSCICIIRKLDKAEANPDDY